jgi:hypothetical protein
MVDLKTVYASMALGWTGAGNAAEKFATLMEAQGQEGDGPEAVRSFAISCHKTARELSERAEKERPAHD